MERLQEFFSIEELYDIIIKDKNSVTPLDNRFPIRLIFLNSFEELQELVGILTDMQDVDIVNISDFLSTDYSWLTPDELEKILKNLSKDSVILPISEYMRFLDDDLFFSTIRRLAELELGGKRFYIPLIGLFERSKNFWDKHLREWAPIWKLNTNPKKIRIYQINYDLDYTKLIFENYALISSTKEWFNIWKDGNIKNIISVSKPLSYYYKNSLPDQTFDLEEISNPKELMEKIFLVQFPINYKEVDEKYWSKLINEIIKYDLNDITFTKLFLKHFNIGNLSTLTIFDFIQLFFAQKSPFDRWFIRNFVISLEKFNSTYSYRCFEKLNTFDNEKLSENFWMDIFQMPSNELTNDISEERRDILKYLHETFQILPNEDLIKTKLQDIVHYELRDKFKYTTNITQTERIFILASLENKDIQKILPELKLIYPELYYYLDWDLIKPDIELDDWIIEYLKEYNLSKIMHLKSKKIDCLIDDHNKNKYSFSEWYYAIPKFELDDDLDENLQFIWVDGLGAEWFPFIIHLISEYGNSKGKTVSKKNITRVNIPSITTCNKYDFEKIDNLDYFVHNQKSYSHPLTLVKEIEIVKDIVKAILNKPFEKICITSDHGLSFLCTKQFGNYRKLEFGDSKHEGRYMWIDESIKCSEDDYYIDWKVDDWICKDRNAIVASKHVSLNRTPAREVHGGATPEEILVPFIMLTTEEDKIEYSINPFKFVDIPSSDPKIKFKINPLPDTIPDAFVNKKPVKISFDQKNNEYIIDLKGLKSKKHEIILKIGTKRFEIDVNIKSGFIEKDLLDF
jgi:hypothetical protein